MTRHEHDEYGEESREIIEGLRHLAGDIETPSDLLANVLTRGEQLLPLSDSARSRWRRALAAWFPRPLIWVPAVAVACFVAGVFVPPPQFNAPVERARPDATLSILEELSAPPMKSLAMEDAGRKQKLSPPRPGYRRQASPTPTPHIRVMTTLPVGLYERLMQKARQRQEDISVVLREAVEAYVQENKAKQ